MNRTDNKKKDAKDTKDTMEAFLCSSVRPDPVRFEQISRFLRDKYEADVNLEWMEDKKIKGGFRLIAGNDIYDWSTESRLKQLQAEWMKLAKYSDGNVVPLLQENLRNWTPKALAEEIGVVATVGDGIATVDG